MFKSPRAQRIDRACAAKQSKPAIGAGDAARRRRRTVYAQEGKYFPLVAANFNPTRQRTSLRAVARPRFGRQHLRSRYRAIDRLLHVRRLGPQPAHGRIAGGACRRATLSGRSGLSFAHRRTWSVAADHRSLAARTDRCHVEIIADQHQNARHAAAPVGRRLRQSQRSRRAGSRAGAGPGDTAAAAQGAGATARPHCGAGRRLSERRSARSRSRSPTSTCRSIFR